MNARRCLLGDTLDVRTVAAVPTRIGLQLPLNRCKKDLFLFVARLVEKSGIARFGAHPEMDQHCCITTIIKDHIRGPAVMPFENFVGKIPVIFEALALNGENRRSCRRNRRCCLILCRINIARSPAYFGAQRLKRLDQHGCLNRHVQRTGNARALQRLGRPELFAGFHQTRHFCLGDLDFLATPIS